MILEPHWKALKEEYKLCKVLGQGTYGQVVKAIHRSTKQVCAIKCMSIDKNNDKAIRNIIRETQLLNELTLMENNNYTTKLYDVIMSKTADLQHVFIVMEFSESDISRVLGINAQLNIDQIIVVMYNLLSAT